MPKPLSSPESPSPPVFSSSVDSTMPTSTSTFHLFPTLPGELRAQIWQASLISHIIRWIRTDDPPTPSSNIFHSSLRHSPLLTTSHEARDHLFLHAHFLSPDKKVWIDPSIDYLHLDLAWTTLNSHGSLRDPLSTLPHDLQREVKKIMVNPNYTDSRLRPGIPVQNFTALERILVVADEKSLGAQGKFLLASVYDLQKYYEGMKRKDSGVKIPYIAIGCLGWTGEEKGKLVHGEEDARQLVAVFDSHAQMKDYLGVMREEEVRFLKERFEGKNSGFKLKFREGKSMEVVEAEGVGRPPGFEELENGSAEAGEDELPNYADLVAADSAADSATSSGENHDIQIPNPA